MSTLNSDLKYKRIAMIKQYTLSNLNRLFLHPLIGIMLMSICSFSVFSGTSFNCETVQSGAWNSPSTWTGCDGSFPDAADKYATIKTGHDIQLTLSTHNIAGLLMEAGSVMTGGDSNGTHRFFAHGSDIDTSLGQIISEQSLLFESLVGSVTMGAVQTLGMNDRLTLNAAQNVMIADSASGIQVFQFYVNSTDPLGVLQIQDDITTTYGQYYDINLGLMDSVVLTGIGLELNGSVDLQGHTLELSISSPNDSVVQGMITGNVANLIKSGQGRVVLNGAVTGAVTTTVTGGELVIMDQHQGNVILHGDAQLGGTGMVAGDLIMNDASSLDPGLAGGVASFPFQVNNLTLNDDAFLAVTVYNLPWIRDQGMVRALGDVNLGGVINMPAEANYDFHDDYLLIDKQSMAAINGQFTGVNEGDVIDDRFGITYVGGDGNDLVAHPVCGTDNLVINENDDGPGSLRDAIGHVCDDGEIHFSGMLNINLNTPIQIDHPFLFINGSGQTITADGGNSAFEVPLESRVYFRELTVQNTDSTSGALVNWGRTNMYSMYFANNSNSSLAGGGAVTNYGTLVVYGSSFYQNNANQGGAIHNDGGWVYISNSTFFENGHLLVNQGGAIYNNNDLEIRFATIHESGDGSLVAGNSIYNTGNGLNFQINNSVVSSSHQVISECIGTPTSPPSFQANFVSDGSCDGEYTGTPGLGSWGFYGGETPTLPLLDGSVLINSGTDPYCSLGGFDQNERPRTIGVTCDIGAFEYIDESPPEVLSVAMEQQQVNACGHTPLLSNQVTATFNEPMYNADDDDMILYEIIHAGADQSFLTADDMSFQVLSADSDLNRPMPTVTLTTDAPIPNGLVRLLLDGALQNEFFLNLYDGDGYQHPYRVDVGNQFHGGHFDDCVGVDPLVAWDIQAISAAAGLDQNNSNASWSLATEIDMSQPLVIEQCVELSGSAMLNIEVAISQQAPGPAPAANETANGGDTFDLLARCRPFDGLACQGNESSDLSALIMGHAVSNQWQVVDFNVGMTHANTQSLLCGLTVTPKQNLTADFLVDGMTLTATTDLIFEHGFD
jgi:hypothetical protein